MAKIIPEVQFQIKRILFIAMNLNSGGAERQMVTLARDLKLRGYDVSFVCYEYGDFFLSQLNDANIPVTWLVEKRSIFRLFRIRSFIRRGNFDTVISFLETANIINAFAAIGKKTWRVVTGERSSKRESITSLRGKILAKLSKYSDVIVCNSFNAAELWNHYYPELSHKIRVVYNLIQVPEIPTRVNRDNKDLRNVVIAASFQYLKNPINVIEAISMLSDKEKRMLRVSWYGSRNAIPSAYKETEEMINRFGLSSVVFLSDATQFIYDKMASADFVGLFSSVEGLPNSICEAMALGKPIIMSKVSDYSVLVRGNGYICDGNDPKSIKSCLSTILSLSSEQIDAMGIQSKLIADTIFNSQTIIEKWMTIIDGHEALPKLSDGSRDKYDTI